VQKLLPETELSKTILETLAVIAWKHPVLQADVIKIRTNKAYDHIKELEELGFITKEKKGRSYLLKVSTKFREYFELPGHDDIKKMFKDVEGAVKDEKLNELEIVDEPEITPHKLGKMEIIDVQKPKEKIPELEVVDVPQEEDKKEKIEVKEEGEEETAEEAEGEKVGEEPEETTKEVPAEKEESEEEEK
jgi:DNA-binding MarR family transcriptional regulator